MMNNEKDITLIEKGFHKNRINFTMENLCRGGGMCLLF